MHNEMQEADVNRKSLIQTFAEFVEKILHNNTPMSRSTHKCVAAAI